jgi:putative salt-induced outer membrane protein YdiY
MSFRISSLVTRHSSLVILFLLSLPLLAQNTDGFETRTHAGLTLNRGNSETTQLTLGADTKRIQDSNEITANAAYTYGQTTTRRDDGSEETSTNVDKADAQAQVNHLYTARTYGLFNLSALSDEIARIDYRILAGPGLGHYLVRNDIWTLSSELGAAMLTENVENSSESYMVLRAAQNFERKLNDHARVWQTLEFLPRAEDVDSYLLNAELGVEARLNGSLSLRVVLQNKYDSTPASDRKNNELTIISGISYAW